MEPSPDGVSPHQSNGDMTTARGVVDPSRGSGSSPDGGADADPVVAELHVVPPRALVALAGELDIEVLPKVRRVLDVAAESPVIDLTIDMGGVDHAGTAACSLLIDVVTAVTGRGGSVAVTRASPVQRRVLELLGLPPHVLAAAAGGVGHPGPG